MHTQRPLIGLTASHSDETRQTWIRTTYMTSLVDAGAVPVLLPLTAKASVLRDMIAHLDGLLLTGGPDIDPVLYGAADEEGLAVVDAERDAQEIPLCRMAVDADLPLLAICRGMQVLNVAMGGTLWVDLPSQRPSPIRHRQSETADIATHDVCILADTPLCEIAGAERLVVNSLHHQAVRETGRDFAITAKTDDGLIEGIWMPRKRFVFGVQWHPEWLTAWDKPSQRLFRSFVEACR